MFTKALSNTLSIAARVAALLLLLCLPSRAQTIEVGTGIFCDTQQQTERFVALFDGDAHAAINAVNAEANNPTACVFGTLAFIRGPEFVTARNKSGAYHIVRVLVVGVLAASGFQAAAPTASFSVERVDERVAQAPKAARHSSRLARS